MTEFGQMWPSKIHEFVVFTILCEHFVQMSDHFARCWTKMFIYLTVSSYIGPFRHRPAGSAIMKKFSKKTHGRNSQISYILYFGVLFEFFLTLIIIVKHLPQ
jgi:hypothetical protein